MRAWLALPLLVLTAVPALGPAPAGCDHATSTAELSDPGAELQALQAAGYQVQPLQAAGYQVQPLLAALPLPGDKAPAEDSLGCGGIRPGARIIIDSAYLCTANWIYRDEAGALYMGTAGHCVGWGSSVSIAGVGRIGDVAFTTGNGGVGNDFALVKVYPQHYHRVNPTMCYWGGPTAIAEDENYGLAPFPLVHYGNGVLYGETPATRQRAGAIHDALVGATSYEFLGTIAPGDSGSAIQFATGHVVGIITHGLIVPGANVGLLVGLGTRIQHGIFLAERSTGHAFEVVYGVPVDLTGLSVP